MRLEIKALDWDMDPNGNAPATPARDIVVYPQFVTIPPHETRRIRTATLVAGRGPEERAYRLSLAEIPQFEGANKQPGVGITFTTTYVLGVYLLPATVRHDAAISRAEIHAGKLTFDVRDSGSVHEHLKGITVNGLAGAAVSAFSKSIDPTIVLAGRSRTFAVPLSSSECAAARAVTIAASTGSQMLTQTIDLSHGSCEP